VAPLVQNEAVRHRMEFRKQLQKNTPSQATRWKWRAGQLRGGKWYRWLVIPGLMGVVYLVFGSSFFWLDELKISGNHLAVEEQITEVLFPKGFKGANAVSWPEGMAKRRLLTKIPQISEVSFRKNLINNTLTVVIKEHQTSIVWQTAGEKFLVNRYGVVYDTASDNTPLIMVEDLKNVPVSINQKVVAPDFIEFVTSFVANLPRKTNITISRITIPETTFEVEMYTNQKWRIILDTTRPPDDQLNSLVRVLREMGDNTPREYIDLRIPNKVFYK
jgi:cell division septal protein FtsQ